MGAGRWLGADTDDCRLLSRVHGLRRSPLPRAYQAQRRLLIEKGPTPLGAGPAHSISRSARTRIDCGNLSPSVLPVLRLTAMSYLVGCCTGRSAGLAPCNILST